MIVSRILIFILVNTLLQGFPQGTTPPEGNLLTDSYVKLSGDWEFYPNEILSEREIAVRTKKQTIKLPTSWNKDSDMGSIQYATLHTWVALNNPANIPMDLAIAMPDALCAYELWVDGKRIGKNGTVGTTKETSHPQWKPETYLFNSTQDTLSITIHLSNFHHYRTGIERPLLLGSPFQLVEEENKIEILNSILLSGLGLLSLAAIIFYIRQKKTGMLLYALLCISWMIRAAFSNHYQIIQWFPDLNWNFAVRVEYISIYLSTFFGCLLMNSLFPKDVNKFFPLLISITCAGFTLFTLVMSPDVFTKYVQSYLGLSSILLLGILIVLVHSYSKNREGAGMVTIAAFLAVIIFGYVILAYEGVFVLNEIAFNIAFLFLFSLGGVAVGRRLHKMTDALDYDTMTFDEALKKK